MSRLSIKYVSVSVTTNTAGDLPTSCKDIGAFVTTNTAKNLPEVSSCPRILLKTLVLSPLCPRLNENLRTSPGTIVVTES